MGLINIDYNDTINKANQLEELADRMIRLCNNDLQSALKATNANWNGETSKMYIKRLTSLHDKSMSQARSLKNVAASMRRRAKTYQNIERTFGGKK